MKRNSFTKRLSIYFVGTLSSNLLNIVLLPIYAYHVKADDLGRYDYYITIASIVTPIMYCAIWEAVLKFCLNNSASESDYKSTAIHLFLRCSIILWAIGSIAFFGTRKESILWIVLTGIIYGAAFLWQFSARASGDNSGYAISGIASSLVFIAVLGVAVMWGKIDYRVLIISHLSSQLFIVLILESRMNLIQKCIKQKIENDMLKEMIRFSFPLAINNVALWLYSGANKIIINKYIGVRENGLYSFSNKFSLLIGLASTIISLALIEEVYSFETVEEYGIRVKKLISIISKFYFAVIALALPSIYILYSLLFHKTEYFDSKDYVFILLLAVLFMALANNFGSSLQITGQTEYIFITAITGAICSIVFSVGTVRYLGVYGVLWGQAIGYFVMMLTRSIYAWKKTRLRIDWKDNIAILTFDMIIYIFLRHADLFLAIIILAIDIIFLGFMYRSEMKQIYRRCIDRRIRR